MTNWAIGKLFCFMLRVDARSEGEGALPISLLGCSRSSPGAKAALGRTLTAGTIPISRCHNPQGVGTSCVVGQASASLGLRVDDVLQLFDCHNQPCEVRVHGISRKGMQAVARLAKRVHQTCVISPTDVDEAIKQIF